MLVVIFVRYIFCKRISNKDFKEVFMGKGKRNKGIALYFKRVAVFVLVMAILLQAIPGIEGNFIRSVGAAVKAGDYIDLEQTSTELYVGSDWAGANAAYIEEAGKVTLDVENFGWNGEWAIQYMVKDLELKENTKYLVEFDITSTIDKSVFIKLDDAGWIAESIDLKAGRKYNFNQVTTVDTNEPASTLFFALGKMSEEYVYAHILNLTQQT